MSVSNQEKNKWQIAKYSEGDERDIVELNNLVFNERKKVDRWDWLMNENPAGKGIINLAKFGDELVGHYTIIPVNLRIKGELIHGAQSLDTMTHPDYRGQGIFTTLAKKVYQEAEKKNIVMVYGFPNKLSYPGLINKLQWEDVCRLPYLVKVLNLDKTVKEMKKGKGAKIAFKVYGTIAMKSVYRSKKLSKIKGINIKKIKRFDEGIENLWPKVSSEFPISIDRNKDYLNWRYFDIPDVNYDVFIEELDKKIIGYIVLLIRKESQLKVGYIVDFIARQDKEDDIQALLSTALDYFQELEVDKIICWMPKRCAYYKVFKKNGFINRPIQYRFTVRPIGPSLTVPFLANSNNWFFTMGDSDII